jgi:hypothetical protein
VYARYIRRYTSPEKRGFSFSSVAKIQLATDCGPSCYSSSHMDAMCVHIPPGERNLATADERNQRLVSAKVLSRASAGSSLLFIYLFFRVIRKVKSVERE